MSPRSKSLKTEGASVDGRRHDSAWAEFLDFIINLQQFMLVPSGKMKRHQLVDTCGLAYCSTTMGGQVAALFGIFMISGKKGRFTE